MGILSQALGWMASVAIQTISFFGYFGVFFLMVLESMIFPIPSELVMPFAGFLAAQGDMNFIVVVLVSALGSLCGSLLSYYIGLYGGNKLVLRFGKYFFLDEVDLMKTEKWFKKKGDITVLISRFIPAVRHFISIPAGMGKMDIRKFCVYTVIGATGWNAFLAYLGYLLGTNWESVQKYSEYISLPLTVILAIAACYFIYRHARHKMIARKYAR